jgi:hypothetical protein
VLVVVVRTTLQRFRIEVATIGFSLSLCRVESHMVLGDPESYVAKCSVFQYGLVPVSLCGMYITG